MHPQFEMLRCFHEMLWAFVYNVKYCEHEIAALLTTFVPRNDVKFKKVAKAPVIARRLRHAVGVTISWSHRLKLGMHERDRT